MSIFQDLYMAIVVPTIGASWEVVCTVALIITITVYVSVLFLWFMYKILRHISGG